MRLIDADALIEKAHEIEDGGDTWSIESADEFEWVLDDYAPTIDIPQWIPCVEEMPEEFVYVLICLKDGAMYVAQLTDYIDIWGNPKWCTNTKHCLGGAILGSEVIAWKPLPEPYGEREGE